MNSRDPDEIAGATFSADAGARDRYVEAPHSGCARESRLRSALAALPREHESRARAQRGSASAPRQFASPLSAHRGSIGGAAEIRGGRRKEERLDRVPVCSPVGAQVSASMPALSGPARKSFDVSVAVYGGLPCGPCTSTNAASSTSARRREPPSGTRD